jgi:flagellar hook protein FlgE
MIDSVLATGVAGVQAGLGQAQQAADNIARSGTTRPEGGALNSITEAVVDLKASEIQVKASAAVIKTADEMIGTLIDIKA